VLVAGPEGVRAAGAARLADVAGQVSAWPAMVPVVFETKVVTATAAVWLAERRVFDLDVPVFGTSVIVHCAPPRGYGH
jgi:hypothetical protein